MADEKMRRVMNVMNATTFALLSDAGCVPHAWAQMFRAHILTLPELLSFREGSHQV